MIKFICAILRYILIVGCLYVVSSIGVQVVEKKIYDLEQLTHAQHRRIERYEGILYTHKTCYDTGEPCNANFKSYNRLELP